MIEVELQARYQAMLPPGLRLTSRDGQDVRFGDLYLAEDTRHGGAAPLTRRVRFRPPDDAPVAWQSWPQWSERFLQRLAKFVDLHLPHVASPLEIGHSPPGMVWIVMPEAGQTLAEWGAAKHRSPAELADVLDQLLEGLAALNAHGLAHGDLRPQTLLVDADDLGRDATRACLARASIGDPVVGLLQTCSHNLLNDHKRDAYYDVSRGATDSPSEQMRADLHALARVACELSLPADERQEWFADRGHTTAAELWQACRAALARGGADGPWRRWPTRFLMGDDGGRRLAATVAVLLGERPGDRAGRWLASWSSESAASDAGQAIERLRKHRRAREAFERATRGMALAAALLLAALVIWKMANGRGLETELTTAKEAQSAAQVELDLAKAHVDELQSSNEDLHARLKQKATNDLATELRTINERLDRLVATAEKTPRPEAKSGGPMKEPDPAAIALENAKGAWRKAFETAGGKSPSGYDKKAAQKLYEEVAGQDKAAAKWIHDWKQGPKGDSGVDDLLSSARPWLKADADEELAALCNQACREPWNKLADAKTRLANLRAAARLWEECAKPSAAPQGLIAAETNRAAKTICSAWYQRLLAPKWTLQLVHGATKLEAGYDDPSRIVTLYAGSTVTGEKHDWLVDEKASANCKNSLNYLASKSPDGTLTFDWQSGANQTIQLYLERDWPWYTMGAKPNLIAGEVFDGPLALWKFNNAGLAESSDGLTTLSYYVVGCPGPPANWNVTRTVANKLKKQAKTALSGDAAK